MVSQRERERILKLTRLVASAGIVPARSHNFFVSCRRGRVHIKRFMPPHIVSVWTTWSDIHHGTEHSKPVPLLPHRGWCGAPLSTEYYTATLCLHTRTCAMCSFAAGIRVGERKRRRANVINYFCFANHPCVVCNIVLERRVVVERIQYACMHNPRAEAGRSKHVQRQPMLRLHVL